LLHGGLGNGGRALFCNKCGKKMDTPGNLWVEKESLYLDSGDTITCETLKLEGQTEYHNQSLFVQDQEWTKGKYQIRGIFYSIGDFDVEC
jgi:hypothetical protein